MTVHAVARCVVLVLLSVSLQISRIDAGCAITPDEAGHVDIPSDWTSIDSNAFNHCYSLETVSIPDSVTTIRGYAFYNCSSLTSITLPRSITEIGRRTFADLSLIHI